MDDPAAALLHELKRRLDRPALAFTDPPARLSGGFFTDNYAFTLAGAPADWSGPLVLRLFPTLVPQTQVRREAIVQRELVAQGYPAPRVLLVGDEPEPFGHGWFIMERLPGRALLGGIERDQLLASIRVIARTPTVMADLFAQLHRVDPDPIVQALGDIPSGVERWFDVLRRAPEEMPGFAAGARWLLDNVPEPRANAVMCHGDLWLGNVLADHGRITGVIDWSVSSVAEPTLELGFAVMPLRIVPAPISPWLQRVAVPIGARLARRLGDRYQERAPADLTNQPYYEALRVVLELGNVYRWREAVARGEPEPQPRPTWDHAADRMVAHFVTISGVDLTLPPPT